MKTFQIEGITKQEFEELLELKIHAGICHLKKELQPEDGILNINQAAKMLGVSRQTIYNYYHSNVPPFCSPIRLGKRIFYKKSIILEFLNKNI